MSGPAGDPFEHHAPAYELAFVEAGRALDAQERAVNELRSSRARNAEQPRWLFRAFRFGLMALLVEVGAWLVSLTERA